ncbi:sugar phosphate isomerase/epimerase family protein [Arthrobacter sp. NPDC058288]|uniref:sugar phosphate isomerase/epimerase family protein n=1 Tax=Arthrobacter sp. NPDC058288 TaxID=3346424 RepID=UPI0036E565A9
MALENHADLHANEMLELLTTIDNPHLGICLDTPNNLRMFDDPALVVEALAPHAKAVHLKDVAAYRGPKNLRILAERSTGRRTNRYPARAPRPEECWLQGAAGRGDRLPQTGFRR